MTDKTNHYIDNDVFFQEMIEWKTKVIEAEDSGDPRPPVTNYIGECFLKISEKLANRPNFMNYPYREEMISDGVENCLMYAHNFNPEKSKNPFSYFTQMIYYAFLRRIEKEKKQSYIKLKLMQENDDGTLSQWFKENYFDTNSDKNMNDFFSLTDNDVENFTTGKKKKKK
jgi:hypothetical protein|tara:strand:+ start:982 stop:1491 length:510 start_codon:yes stop_codon:yes gene_type:complete